MYYNYCLPILLIFGNLNFLQCERLHEQIYSSIEGGAACFRRLNGTHQMGCSSPDNGAVGVVHMIKEVSDAHWMTQNASAGPYMAVISTTMFKQVIDIFMERPDNVAGVLLFDNSTFGITSFTHDSKCPNEYSSGPGSTCSSSDRTSAWNREGTNLLRRDIPFPIFFLPESKIDEIKKIEDCFRRYNLDLENQKGRPLCSVQLHSFMFAAVDSTVCMRRSASSALLTPAKVCDPLGDYNVYYSLFPRVKESKYITRPVILVTARIDSASLFDGVSPGTASSAVGMATLITAAATLAKMLPSDSGTYGHNVLFTLFNGEAFDYIGSQRVAYDISVGQWPPAAPLTPADVPLHLELGQLGGSLLANAADQSWPLTAFASVDANSLDKINDIVSDLTSNLNNYNLSLVLKATDNLPPSSLHSFRRILKNVTSSGSLAEVLIVDHKDEFTNMFYNSALDVYETIGFKYHNISIGANGTFVSTDDLIANGTMRNTEVQVKIAFLATAVARTLYKKVTGEAYGGNLSASAHLVDETLYCFLGSQACRLLLAADYGQNSGGEENLPERPAPLYVGVSAWPASARVFAGHLIALLSGDHLAGNRSQCDALNNADYSYYWLKGWDHKGVCVQTTMNFSAAISPAFTLQDYDMKSGQYSTWTESVWQTMWARVFVASGGGGAARAAGAGAAATLLAAALTYWLRSRAAAIFGNASVPAGDAATGILRTVNC